LQRKTAKDQADATLKAAQLQIERDRISAQQETEGAKLAAKVHGEQAQRDHSHEQKGFSSAVDMQKHGLTLSHQQQMARYQAEQQAQKPTKKGD
jgi:hypothetical protein